MEAVPQYGEEEDVMEYEVWMGRDIFKEYTKHDISSTNVVGCILFLMAIAPQVKLAHCMLALTIM